MRHRRLVMLSLCTALLLSGQPAGGRGMVGHNVRTLEAVIPPRKLHSAQQIRTANYILQSADPTGINDARDLEAVGRRRSQAEMRAEFV